MLRSFIALAILLLCTGASRAAGEAVHVIAESVSTEAEAQRILTREGWMAASLQQAQFVLVVVRSEQDMPLTGFYASIAELKQEVDMQLNGSGSKFVVYLFALDGDRQPTELKRTVYPVND